jgi:putative phosphonate metabolism protein
MTVRYAIYYAPPANSPLWKFGCDWLGRDAETGEERPQPALSGITRERLAELTESPRLYGFHATLKPPFALAHGKTREGLIEALHALASSRRGFSAPALTLASISGFLALVPAERAQALHDLADACVAGFDSFRAPASAAELARRRKAKLSPRQEEYLANWGYPYVFEEFRLHLTLTERLSPEDDAILRPVLADLVGPLLGAALPIEELSLFEQPEPAAPFALIGRYPLARAG